MPSYKLVYFNSRGRAEVCRLLFFLAGQNFQDVRLSWMSDEAKAYQSDVVTNQLPVLEVDGKKFTQSRAIQSYLARKFGFHGSTDLEALQIEEVVGIADDLFSAAIAVIWRGDDAKIAALNDFKENAAPRFLTALTKLLMQSKTDFFVGCTVTLADISAYEVTHNLARLLQDECPELLDDFPTLIEHGKKIENLDRIRQYVQKRVWTPA